MEQQAMDSPGRHQPTDCTTSTTSDSLHWKHERHSKSLKSNIISMYRTADLYDVILVVNGNHFLCHRLVLAAGSSYFHTMFTSNWAESDMSEIAIEGFEKEVFKDVLQYLYCGELDINENNVQGLMHASDVFFLEQLKQGCVQYYQRDITPHNCLGIWQFSDQCNAKVLQQQSLQLALTEFPTVWQHQEFLELTPDNLCHYLSHPDLCINSHEAVMDAFLAWLQHYPHIRASKVMDILPKLNVLSQNPRTIKQKLLDETLIRSNTEASIYLQGILNHLLFSEPLPEGTTLQPLQNNSPYVTSSVMLGGYSNSHRSKLCHLATYQESSKSVSTSAICDVPSYYNIEMASCVLHDVIYVSGCGVEADEIWKLDMNRELWTKCCDMLEGRICHTMVTGPASNANIYIIGGYNQSEDTVLGNISVYDTGKNDIVDAGRLVKPTACCTAQFYDSKIYTFGGVTNEDRPSPWIQVIDINTNQSMLLPLKLPVAANRLQSVLCVDKMIVLGIYNSFVIDIKSLNYIVKQATEGSSELSDRTDLIEVRPGVDCDLFSLHLLGDKLVKMGGRRQEQDYNLTDRIEMVKVEDYLRCQDAVWQFIGRLPSPTALYMTGLVLVKSNTVNNHSFTAL